MKFIEKYITKLSPSYYTEQLTKLTEKQKEELNLLIERIEKAGAKDPLSWAFSEIRENIAQFARFSFLKGIYAIIDDVDENIGLADDIDEEYEEDIHAVQKKLGAAIGEKELKDFLRSYTKGVMWQVANLIDEGNFYEDSQPSWVLSEIDEHGDLTGRLIDGLRESFSDFENDT